MCSVFGCDSSRRGAERFKLPEEPDRRLAWLQFVLEVNGQQLKESSWLDVSVCSEHFTWDCFVNPGRAPAGAARLAPGAVPSLCNKAEPSDAAWSPKHEPDETPVAVLVNDFTQCESQFSCSVKTEDASPPEGVTPPRDTSPAQDTTPPEDSPDGLDAATPEPGRIQEKVLSTEVNKKIASLLKTKGNFVVNEKCLLQLFPHDCPSCGAKLEMRKVTCESSLVLDRRCRKGCYSNRWQNLSDAVIPAAEGGGATAESQQVATPASAVCSEVLVFSGDESGDPPEDEEEAIDPSGDEEEGTAPDPVRDDDWNPADDPPLESEESDEEASEADGDAANHELCTECGSFFDKQKPHTCVHKTKPFPCGVCGKRCSNELALKSHARIHDEAYEHPCKYCNVTFKSKANKVSHELTHQNTKNPYECPDCPRTFASWKQRRNHLRTHRGPAEHRCDVCGVLLRHEGALQRHMLVHTGLKPYKCSVCERSFSQASHLKSHMRLHTGERPYKCRHCDKAFNHNVSLKSHVQRCHAELADDVGEQRDLAEVKASKAPKKRCRSTGRPRGRPKSKTATGETEKQCFETAKSKAERSKRTGSSSEESEDDQLDSDVSFHSEEEGGGDEESAKKNSRKRRKHDSDSDFDPEEVK